MLAYCPGSRGDRARKRLRSGGLAAFALILAGCSVPCLNAHVAGGRPLDMRKLRPGTYRVVLRAVSGRQAGKHIEGTLWLERTSPEDRSHRTGKAARAADQSEDRLWFYGAAVLPFAEIGITFSGTDPASRDPVYPGVLVSGPVRRKGDRAAMGTPVLWIGTSLRRDGVTVMDGEQGVTLGPHQLTRTGFSGVFFTRSVQGVFCATFVSSSRRKTRTPLRPRPNSTPE